MRFLLLAAALLPLSTAHAGSTVPMTPAGNGHLVVPAYVNGKGTVPFILDTGADESSVYDWFAKQQGLPPGAPIEVTGMTGISSQAAYRLSSLSVAGREIRDVEVSGLPDRKDAAITAGVTGNDLMDGAIAIFDYGCRTVSLTAKPVSMRPVLGSGATKVDAGSVREGTQLTFPVRINGATGIAVLDTGSRGTQINGLFARAAGLDVDGPGFGPGETLYGAASVPIETREGRVAEIRFADRTVRATTVRVVDLPVFRTFGIDDRPAMIFGINAMHDLRIVYDHESKRFWFDRSTCRT